jgi:hypothetical protein
MIAVACMILSDKNIFHFYVSSDLLKGAGKKERKPGTSSIDVGWLKADSSRVVVLSLLDLSIPRSMVMRRDRL